MDSKKIILIVAVIAVIGFFVLYRKKNDANTSSANSSDEGATKSSVANSILNSVTDTVSAVELSEEDEEYNLLRQEYADRYGSAAKQSWSKAMIQQKIDEYDERSSLLDQLVAISGNDAYESAKELNADDINRLIETEKKRKAQEFEDAKNYYKISVGDTAPAKLDTAEKIKQAIGDAYTSEMKKYEAMFGSSKEISSLTTAKQIKAAYNSRMAEDMRAWNERRVYLQGYCNNLMSGLDRRGTTGNKRWLMDWLFPELIGMSDRDFIYACDFCADAYAKRGLDFYGNGVMYDIVNRPIIFFRENRDFVLTIITRKDQLHGAGVNWNKIDQYGHLNK